MRLTVLSSNELLHDAGSAESSTESSTFVAPPVLAIVELAQSASERHVPITVTNPSATVRSSYESPSVLLLNTEDSSPVTSEISAQATMQHVAVIIERSSTGDISSPVSVVGRTKRIHQRRAETPTPPLSTAAPAEAGGYALRSSSGARRGTSTKSATKASCKGPLSSQQ